MIPKIIHYCWFGRNRKSKLIEKCIKSWKIFLPDYTIIEWNEDNFDINSNTYTKQAYEVKKYAFVSDYARFYILYKYGGIYLDTDVEVLKSLNDLLNNKMFSGFENSERVAPGLILGAEKKSFLIKEIMDSYNDKEFITTDGIQNTETVVSIMTNILKPKGLILNGSLQCVGGMTIYPIDYFSPKSYFTGQTIITDNTYTIHHYAGSWVPLYIKLESKFWNFCKMDDRRILDRLSKKYNKAKFKLLS